MLLFLGWKRTDVSKIEQRVERRWAERDVTLTSLLVVEGLRGFGIMAVVALKEGSCMRQCMHACWCLGSWQITDVQLITV